MDKTVLCQENIYKRLCYQVTDGFKTFILIDVDEDDLSYIEDQCEIDLFS